MKRISVAPRAHWQQTVESQGLTFHSRTGQYWNEEAAYVFTAKEIDTLERAANDVHELCLQAAQHVIDKNLFSELAIAPEAAELVKKSWNNDELHLYGRFDFSYDGVHPPKMLEYNADTPTSLLEASVIQWHWLQTCFPEKDQFNSLHESLIARWKQLDIKTPVHFTTLSSAEEDVMTTEYLRDTAHQAGLETTYLHLEEVGYNAGTKRFVNGRNNNRGIDALFKLYPWEWMIHEEYGQNLSTTPMRWIEPPWKMLWSNKGILPILWKLFPEHPNLLAAYDNPQSFDTWAKKPLLSREGANIELRTHGNTLSTEGEYGEEGFIYQAFSPLPNYGSHYPVLGLWMIGDECRGMGIRESDSLITGNLSRFTPHYFEESDPH